ncbi:MAG: STAS domain-containing protein [Thermodesulfobacteriota bacterium]|nr:STAS domain-containing protein [Thermodesulfobacteriota bacterium]
MIIDKREENGVVVLEPAGRLDSNTAPVLEHEIDSVGAGNDGHHLLVDFSNVEYISSAGLRVVLKVVKERQTSPKSFAVSSMQDHVREVFEISGFDAFITIYPDAMQAVVSFA